MALVLIAVLAGLAFGWVTAFWLTVGVLVLWAILEVLDL